MVYEDFLAKFTDWRPETLYWQRFSIAEGFGKKEIERTYEAVFEEAKKNYKNLTELVMILNHKCWQHCESLENNELCKFYISLFNKAKKYAERNLKEDELKYYLRITD